MIAMNLVETLTNAITGPINAMLGQGNTTGQYLQTGQTGGARKETFILVIQSMSNG